MTQKMTHTENKQKNVEKMHVLKVGGNELHKEGFLPGLARLLAQSPHGTVVVHGGGKAIASLQKRLGIHPKKVDGLRVTDAPSLEVAQMVLCGKANKEIVTALLASGIDAVGLSGIDAGLITCRKKSHPGGDLGFVGEVVEVRADLLRRLAQNGLTPVISPISLGEDGQVYNVNADEAACAVASSLKADLLDFVSNVPGVKDGETVYDALTEPQTQQLITEGVIRGGMIPKVSAALQAVGNGVATARIINLEGLGTGAGTSFGVALERSEA